MSALRFAVSLLFVLGVHALGQRVVPGFAVYVDLFLVLTVAWAFETGTLGELRHLTRTSISVETDSPPDGLGELPGVHGLEVVDHRARFDVDTNQLDGALRRLSTLGIRSLTSQPPTLEELFLRHYGDELDRAVDAE